MLWRESVLHAWTFHILLSSHVQHYILSSTGSFCFLPSKVSKFSLIMTAGALAIYPIPLKAALNDWENWGVLRNVFLEKRDKALCHPVVINASLRALRFVCQREARIKRRNRIGKGNVWTSNSSSDRGLRSTECELKTGGSYKNFFFAE